MIILLMNAEAVDGTFAARLERQMKREEKHR